MKAKLQSIINLFRCKLKKLSPRKQILTLLLYKPLFIYIEDIHKSYKIMNKKKTSDFFDKLEIKSNLEIISFQNLKNRFLLEKESIEPVRVV